MSRTRPLTAESVPQAWTRALPKGQQTKTAIVDTAASKNANVTYTIKRVPEYYEPAATSGGAVNWPRSTPG